MKLPSIGLLWSDLKNVLQRFPLQVFIAVAAVLIWVFLIDARSIDRALENSLIKLLAMLNIAFTLLLASDLYCETNGCTIVNKWIFRVGSCLLAILLYFVLDPFLYGADVYRLLFLIFAFHLLVAFAPFVQSGNLNGFWQYNKTLFLRFLISAFYAAVLFAGIAIALVAIDGLFNVKVRFETYFSVFALVTAGFATIFFLAGIPKNINTLSLDETYPKGLKIFTQYVLIPLMTIYLVILLVYEIKIIIDWELPKGLVSTLILGYAVFGILSLLLIYPIREKEGNGWIKIFSKFFYLTMVPLIVLLFLAIIKRVGNYGITEARYVLIVLAVWLSAVTIYFLLAKKQNIKVIPLSLCVIALLSAFGPQSAAFVAKQSQLSRMRTLQKVNSGEAKEEVQNIVRYLLRHHGLTSIQSFVKKDLAAVEANVKKEGQRLKLSTYDVGDRLKDSAFAFLKIDETNLVARESFTFKRESGYTVGVKSYDILFDTRQDNMAKFVFDNTDFEIAKGRKLAQDGDEDHLIITIAQKEKLTFDVKALGKRLALERQALKTIEIGSEVINSDSAMEMVQESDAYSFKFVATQISGSFDSSIKDYTWFTFDGYLLIKKK